jgi:hypothetical protein
MFAALLAVLLSGCATYKSGTVQVKDVTQYGNATTTNGVSVGAELYSDPAKTQEAFYVDLTEKSYYPVQLAIHNGTDGRVLVLKDNIEIDDSKGNSYKPVNVAVMTDEFEHNKMAYALLGFGIFSYMSADDANKKMAADWSSKELPSELIVNPDRKNAGFIYFKMPNGLKPNGMTLVVPVETLENKGVLSFKLAL